MRRTGRFEYRTLLPGEINAEGIDAALRDWVLTVKVPKEETAKPRRIEITSGD
ncbi:Hsp20/alpha crystallin family protein [Streptomyces sp. NPDC058067]|uniref:Hsp20/alpha crystallin family protein n=1 Tax=Streptomyces sp. NPDC058067 TaxID=3346324 RepID=UPI0036E54C41